MEYKITDCQGHKLAHGKSTNPYQVRNIIQQFLEEPYTTTDSNTIHTSTLRIWCSAELSPLLQPTPRIIDNTPPPGPILPLKVLCSRYKQDPARIRRIIRKQQGANHQRYSFTAEEFEQLILRRK